MLFTVVIPVFNSANYITDSLKSIEKASSKINYEIILVDDGSNDIADLKKVLRGFDKAYLIEKELKTNAADSRNIGFLRSKGRYVFFLDSDDRFLPDAIDQRLKFHQSQEKGIVFGNFIIKSNNGARESNLPNYSDEDMREYILVKKGDFRSSVLSIDKEYFGNTSFDPKSKKHQDWIFAFRCWDNKETIGFDEYYMTTIDVGGSSRMSASLNVDASRYLCENYLSKVRDINSFSKNNWPSMIQLSDYNACHFFTSIYQPQDKKDKLRLKFYQLVGNKKILPYSSRGVAILRKIKTKYVSNRFM